MFIGKQDKITFIASCNLIKSKSIGSKAIQKASQNNKQSKEFIKNISKNFIVPKDTNYSIKHISNKCFVDNPSSLISKEIYTKPKKYGLDNSLPNKPKEITIKPIPIVEDDGTSFLFFQKKDEL